MISSPIKVSKNNKYSILWVLPASDNAKEFQLIKSSLPNAEIEDMELTQENLEKFLSKKVSCLIIINGSSYLKYQKQLASIDLIIKIYIYCFKLDRYSHLSKQNHKISIITNIFINLVDSLKLDLKKIGKLNFLIKEIIIIIIISQQNNSVTLLVFKSPMHSFNFIYKKK